MDLRNRDSYELITKDLKSVASDSFHQLSDRLSEIAAQEAQVEKEASLLRTRLYEKALTSRISKIGTKTGDLRIHAFSYVETMKDGGRVFSFRLCGDEIADSSCFSDFVSKVDFVLRPSGENLCWNRSDDRIDGITISRPYQEDIQIEALIHVNYSNCLYLVPEKMLTGKGSHHQTFVDLFKTICAYIKNHNLSSNDDPSYFTPDAVLHDLLYPNHPKDLPVSFASLLEVIKTRFKAPGPFRVTHKVGSPEQVFDLVVHLTDHSDDSVFEFVQAAERKLRSRLLELDGEIGSLTEGLREVAQDTKFLQKFSSNPVSFLGEIIDMPTGMSSSIETSSDFDYLNMMTSHEFYKQPWAITAAAYVVNEQRKEARTQA
jgi:hypothetical protein